MIVLNIALRMNIEYMLVLCFQFKDTKEVIIERLIKERE